MSLQFPGEGMKIERIPLPDDIIRLEALKAAVTSRASSIPSVLLDDAAKFEDYIRNGREPREFCDEQTIGKAAHVLNQVGSITYTGEQIVDMLLNEGLLFRERRSQ